MKYVRKYPTVRAGSHAPDERLYRGYDWQPCKVCAELTDWVDIRLRLSVCSEECHYKLATGRDW
jgi:hypothetical protein